MDKPMKSLVLLTFFSLSPGAPTTTGKVEFFDNEAACQVRMDEIRSHHTAPGSARCSCKKIVPPVEATGNNAI